MVGMEKSRLILITNPGSSSRKYALYRDDELLCSLHFEFEDGKVICTLKKADGSKKKLDEDFKSLDNTVEALNRILTEEKYLGGVSKIDAVLARVVAPGEYFAHDHIVDDECLMHFEVAEKQAPLHVPVVSAEVEKFVEVFEDTPVIEISDSAFHDTRPDVMKYYAFDTDLADKSGVKRYGFHGLSVGSITEYMKSQDILPEKLVVCHIGSGSSVTAVFHGKSFDTTMGYTPLQGVMMSTRCGDIDTAAALAIGRELNLSGEELEKYLNKKCGLLGVSGKSDDMREIIKLQSEGDKKGALAFSMYIYRLQSAIGQMVASMGGVDAIVFTATIGERSDIVRKTVCQKLGYLGFNMDEAKNAGDLVERHVNVGTKDSKPIWVIRTDEFAEMIRRAKVLLDK